MPAAFASGASPSPCPALPPAQLMSQLQNGSAFADVAKANSTCPSKAKGGDLGSFKKGQARPAGSQAFRSVAHSALSATGLLRGSAMRAQENLGILGAGREPRQEAEG